MPDLEWKNLDAYLARTAKWPDDLRREIAANTRRSVENLASRVRERTPVSDRAPHIVNTIRTEMIDELVGQVLYGDENRPAGPLEMGHTDYKSGKHVKAEPILRPEAKKEKRAYKAANKKSLDTVLNK